MEKTRPHIYSETGRLKKVVIGIADKIGPIPSAEDCYDPKSRESVLKDIYPEEKELIAEINGFAALLESYGVDVLRPKNIDNLNQVFARDISFALEDKFIVPNIIEDRAEEIEGVQFLIDQLEDGSIVEFKDGVHAEGGDCMPYHDHLFIGYSPEEEFKKYKTARTNFKAVERMKELFPAKKIYPVELVKNDDDPRQGILHLDCCFQPIGAKEAIIFPGGFKHQRDVDYITNLIGQDNLITVSRDEFYSMFPNVFSIDQNTIVSNTSFVRLNKELEQRGYTVETIPYDKVSLMGGLLRCSSMPLHREKL